MNDYMNDDSNGNDYDNDNYYTVIITFIIFTINIVVAT